MKRRSPEQIVRVLHEVDEELSKGKTIEAVCREKQISPATYHRWKQKYGGMNVQEAKRIKALENENAKLKRLLAESILANDAGYHDAGYHDAGHYDALKEFLAKKV